MRRRCRVDWVAVWYGVLAACNFGNSCLSLFDDLSLVKI